MFPQKCGSLSKSPPPQENLCSTGFSKALEEEGPCVVSLQSPAQLLFPATLCHLLSLNLIHVLNADQSSPRDAGETRELAYVGDSAEYGSCCSARVGSGGKGGVGNLWTEASGSQRTLWGGVFSLSPSVEGGLGRYFQSFQLHSELWLLGQVRGSGSQ